MPTLNSPYIEGGGIWDETVYPLIKQLGKQVLPKLLPAVGKWGYDKVRRKIKQAPANPADILPIVTKEIIRRVPDPIKPMVQPAVDMAKLRTQNEIRRLRAKIGVGVKKRKSSKRKKGGILNIPRGVNTGGILHIPRGHRTGARIKKRKGGKVTKSNLDAKLRKMLL